VAEENGGGEKTKEQNERPEEAYIVLLLTVYGYDPRANANR